MLAEEQKQICMQLLAMLLRPVRRRSSRPRRELMSNVFIPAPQQFDHNGGEFAFRSGTTISCQ
jgi:hypothetical protein